MEKRRDYLEPRIVQVAALCLESELLGASLTPAVNPVRILGHDSFGEFDYTSGTFVDAWYD